MMKKLLVLLMVLGMATMANAALQISVNGEMNPVDSMITIAPSDELVLDIWTDAQILQNSGFDFVLVTQVAGASIDYLSGVIVYTESGLVLYHDGDAINFLGSSAGTLPAGLNGIGGDAWAWDAAIAAGTTLFDQINFHCTAPGDVTISLFNLDENFNVLMPAMDTVIVHQVIPEPMTMALLGLGGLFLRRRK